MSLHNPKVTVVMPAYNAETYLRQAIDSILNQTFNDFELLIINDGSTDATFDIINSYNDNKIRLINNEKNIGLVEVRNLGVYESKGKYIAFLDADDIAYPARLSEQVNFLDHNYSFGMIGSSIELIYEKGLSPGKVMKYPADSEMIPSLLLFGNYFAQSSLMIRKDILPTAPYREYPGTEDYDLWIRIANTHKIWNLPLVLVKYRIHTASISLEKADVIEEYVRTIVTNYLASIGVTPSKSELDVHRKIGSLKFPATHEFLLEAETWLLRLFLANSTACFFKSPCFECCLGEKWYLVCRESSQLGIKAWQLFWKSDLHKYANLSLWQQFKFLVRCAIKWQGKR